MADRRRRGGRTLILVLFILILLGIIAFAAIRMMGPNLFPGTPNNNNPAPNSTLAPSPTPIPKTVVVANGDIKRGQYLTEDKLKTAQLEGTEEGAIFHDPKELKGMRALADIKNETAITSNMAVKDGANTSVPSFEIPAGKVAISVPISRLSSVSYGLQKGDHVNVIASLLMIDLDTNFQTALPDRTGYVLGPGPMKEDVVTSLTARGFMGTNFNADAPAAATFFGRIELDPTLNVPMWLVPGEPQRSRLVSQTLLQDVVVLQLGYFNLQANNNVSLSAPSTQATPAAAAPAAPPAAAPAAAPAGQATPAAAPTGLDVVTLIVDPQEAVTLNYMMLSGANMNLVLRSAGDDSRVDTESVTLQFLLDQYRITNPAKLPYGIEPRLDKFPSSIPAFPEPGPTQTPVP